MGIFSRKKPPAQAVPPNALVQSSREQIQGNLKKLDIVLASLGPTTPTLAADIARLRARYEFVAPGDRQTEAVDKKISDRLDDLRLSIARGARTGSYADANDILTKISVLMAER
ncbi:MAG: hypothetical protein LBM78_00335 [Clostridiales bacterium]|jgi:hypothetical protein|nr:hypothetical protein [Clostridiales bacterium]